MQVQIKAVVYPPLANCSRLTFSRIMTEVPSVRLVAHNSASNSLDKQ